MGEVNSSTTRTSILHVPGEWKKRSQTLFDATSVYCQVWSHWEHRASGQCLCVLIQLWP